MNIQKLSKESLREIRSQIDDELESRDTYVDIGQQFFYVGYLGKISNKTYSGCAEDNRRKDTGNFFRTEAEAKASTFYLAHKSKYVFWIRGESEELENYPFHVEVLLDRDGQCYWEKTHGDQIKTSHCFVFRWKK
tara:strand:- start:194 stop:598 length:405 start_codon:yes stop_codon:yes gene_type:complete